MISNLAADCAISLKFRTEFERLTLNVLQAFKVKGQRSQSQYDVTTAQIC